MPTVREAVLDLLRATGMTTVFGNPGSTELPFLAPWPDDLRYVLALQEASAVAMADGHARATGRAAFVNLHAAAGVGHGLGNLFTAFRNQVPLVVTAGQQSRSLLMNQPFLGADEAAHFPKPYVKWSIEPPRAEDVPAAIAQAHRIAMQRPRGPCFVSVPADDWARPCAAPAHRGLSADTAPDPVALGLLGDALAAASRPVLVSGPEVEGEGAGPALVRLAERLGAPVWTSPFNPSLGFPEDHPLFAGHLVAAPEAVARALGAHDLILVIGAPVFTFHVPHPVQGHVQGHSPGPVPGDCGLFDGGTSIWHLTADGGAAARAPAGESILGALRFALPALTALLPEGASRAPPTPRPRAAPPVARNPMPAALVLARLAALWPEGALLAEEAPSHRPAMHAHLPVTRWGGFLTMASGGLGYALPAAVGAALAQPGRRVVCVIGDGSLMYSVQALWTAAQHGLPLSVVVLNNAGYGAMRAFSRVVGVTGAPGIDLPGLDLSAIARGHGCAAARIEDHRELDDALAQALGSPGPFLLDVAVETEAAALYDEKPAHAAGR